MVESSGCLDDGEKIVADEDIYPAGPEVMSKLPSQADKDNSSLDGLSDAAIEKLSPERRALLEIPHEEVGTPSWQEKAAAETTARSRAEKGLVAAVAVGGLAGVFIKIRNSFKKR